MKITKASNTAVKSFGHCQFKYFLHYDLGIEEVSGKAAILGNIVHEVLESLAKLSIKSKTIDYEWLLDWCWDYYVNKNEHLGLRKFTSRGLSADYKKCLKNIEKVMSDLTYSPNNMKKIIGIEEWFSVELPWDVGNDQQFKMRGYIDIIREIDKDTIEIIDWKTGNRVDVFSRKKIDVYQLMREAQPRIYHLAVSLLKSQYKNVIVTFYYIEDGGPVTVAFDSRDLVYTLSSLWKFMQNVQEETLLKRNKTWKCKMCSYYKDSICDRVWDDFRAHGTDYVRHKYGGIKFDKKTKTYNDKLSIEVN